VLARVFRRRPLRGRWWSTIPRSMRGRTGLAIGSIIYAGRRVRPAQASPGESITIWWRFSEKTE